VTALTNGYNTLASAYANENPSQVGDALRSRQVARRYGHEDTVWGTASRDRRSSKLWQVDPFGLIKVLKHDRKKGITGYLLEWGNEKVFLPRYAPDFIYFYSTREWKFVHEDANVPNPTGLPVFLLTPPADSQFSEEDGPFEEPAIPSAPIP
jgi:hypothetical protein